MRVSVYKGEVPEKNYDWIKPVGTYIKAYDYLPEHGWRAKEYKIIKYYPHIVLCKGENGQYRSFTHWEFQKRQKGRLYGVQGGGSHVGTEERLSGRVL